MKEDWFPCWNHSFTVPQPDIKWLLKFHPSLREESRCQWEGEGDTTPRYSRRTASPGLRYIYLASDIYIWPQVNIFGLKWWWSHALVPQLQGDFRLRHVNKVLSRLSKLVSELLRSETIICGWQRLRLPITSKLWQPGIDVPEFNIKCTGGRCLEIHLENQPGAAANQDSGIFFPTFREGGRLEQR